MFGKTRHVVSVDPKESPDGLDDVPCLSKKKRKVFHFRLTVIRASTVSPQFKLQPHALKQRRTGNLGPNTSKKIPTFSTIGEPRSRAQVSRVMTSPTLHRTAIWSFTSRPSIGSSRSFGDLQTPYLSMVLVIKDAEYLQYQYEKHYARSHRIAGRKFIQASYIIATE